MIIKKVNNQLENQKLSELRDWLLPMLMNGQVSVGGVEKEIEGLGWLLRREKFIKL
ncbi:hypothetical protein [Polaribacter sp. R77954]|uniref:hypothetical protein n=1 Tax=Polaribacter sp. R77954 TaxID=3093870 RepID=UPI0037CBD4D2